MAVVSVSTLIVKPDRYEDYLDFVRKTKAIMEKHGAKNVRLLAGLVAGEATGSFVFTFEANDFAAWGAVGDKFFADPEGQALAASMNSSVGPISSQQQTVWVDVPL
jgi:hypothetical protein